DRLSFPEPPTLLEEFADRERYLELNEVFIKACETDVEKRYQSGDEIHADLALLLSGKSVKRLHQVERRLRLMTRGGLAALAVMVLGAFPYFLAIKEAQRASSEAKHARAAEQATRRESYAHAMLLAQDAAQADNFAVVQELLEQTHSFAEESRVAKVAHI